MSSPAYSPFYCEENIWQLCGDAQFAGADVRVLFISNPSRRVAMWGQRAAVDPAVPIVWDYHVVLLVRQLVPPRPGDEWLVWDLDASEQSPQPATAWLRSSFDAIGLLPPIYAPRFRMIAGAEYRRHFRSDRRHMRDVDGSPTRPPPPWPPILGEPPACAPTDDGNNLERFIDTEDPSFLGQRFDLPTLRRWLETQRAARA